MRVELIELLADREIVHPTTISSVVWAQGELVMSITGYRWWEQPYSGRKSDGAIRFIFGGVTGGALRCDEFHPEDDEALDDFEITPVADVGWAQPKDWSLFCSSAIPQPMALYVGLHDFLAREGAFYAPGDFLNCATEISRFVAMARAPGFMLGQGPGCVRDLLCAELERQGVVYNVIQTLADQESRMLVRIGGSSFLCNSAVAEFEGRHDSAAGWQVGPDLL